MSSSAHADDPVITGRKASTGWPAFADHDTSTSACLRREHDPAVTLEQNLLEILDRRRLAEVIALHLVAAFCDQQLELLRSLDALGHHGDVERQRQVDDRLDDRHRLAALGDVVDERSVDLDLVERKAAQI